MKRHGISLLLILLAAFCFFTPVQAKGTWKLPAPKITKVSNEAQGIKIKWKKVSGAAKYRVFYKTGSKWRKLADTKSTSYTWTKAVSGKKYRFRVRCITKKGKKYTSGYSKATTSVRYIAAPVITGLANTSDGIMISWGSVKGAAKYRLYYKKGSKWKKIKDTTSTSFVWKKAESGKTYTFTVRCITSGGSKYTSGYHKEGSSITADKVTASFSSSAQTVNIGSTGKLSVTANGMGTLFFQYSSSNPAVLRVELDGSYEAVSAGQARVSCTVSSNYGASATCYCDFTVVEFSAEYMSGVFYQRLKAVSLTGNYRADMIAVALSQVGYYEGNSATQLSGMVAGSKNYTEYGRYYGNSKTAWCSEFASWCARQAHIPTTILANSPVASASRFKAPYYSWDQTVYGNGRYMPQAGDLLLVLNEDKDINDSYLSHTAIVYYVKEIKEKKETAEKPEAEDNGEVGPAEGDGQEEQERVSQLHIYVIHGNVNKCVQRGYYIVDAEDGYIRGYVRLDPLGTSKVTEKQAHVGYIVAPNYGAGYVPDDPEPTPPETEPDPEQPQESESNSGTESESGSGTESESGSGTESESGSGTESESGSGTESGSGSGTESGSGSGTESGSGSGMESGSGSGMESGSGSGTESGSGSGTESETGQSEPQETDPNLPQETDPNLP